MKYLLAIFFLGVGVFAAAEYKRQHDLENRAVTAVRILHSICVRTPNEDLQIVYANTWRGNVCVEYVFDDAREQSSIRFAVLEEGSKFLNYDLDQDDIEDRCNATGIDLTNVAEKELKDMTLRDVD